MEIPLGVWGARTRIVAIVGIGVAASALALVAVPAISAHNTLREAQMLVGAGETAAAAELCQRVLRSNPDDRVAREILGACYYNGGRWEEATVELKRAIGRGNVDPQTHALLARSYRLLERWAEAEAVYRKALTLYPSNRIARKEFAEFQREMMSLRTQPAPVAVERSRDADGTSRALPLTAKHDMP